MMSKLGNMFQMNAELLPSSASSQSVTYACNVILSSLSFITEFKPLVLFLCVLLFFPLDCKFLTAA